MKEEASQCVSCGERAVREGDVTLTREVGEHVFSATVSGLVCSACGESITDLADGERFDLAVAEILAEAAPTGDAFRFLRKLVGLRARDLARMLGITGDTISRWENGKHGIDRAAFFVLGQIARERRSGGTAMLDLLVRGEMPKPLPRLVNVHLE
jgi:putative zinc finger/helix-turn-helix YgiT family protein